MANTIVPQIINAGIYDAATVHKNRLETPKRHVSVFEIELPCAAGGISYINKKQHDISPNYIICGKPSQVRHTHLPFKCRFIHLRVEDEFLKNLLMSFPDFIYVEDNLKKYTQLFNEIIRTYLFPSENYELYIGGKILQLLYMMSLEDRSTEDSEIKSDDIVSQGIAYINEHFTENITLSDIAASIGVSPTYFHQLFTRTMGKTTPLDYILKKRIDLAKKLLVTSTYTLAQVAYYSGFSSQSYFGQVFKKKANITPSKYREKYYSKYPEN